MNRTVKIALIAAIAVGGVYCAFVIVKKTLPREKIFAKAANFLQDSSCDDEQGGSASFYKLMCEFMCGLVNANIENKRAKGCSESKDAAKCETEVQNMIRDYNAKCLVQIVP